MNKNKHTQGFKVPDQYFDSIEETVFQKLDEHQFPKKTGFDVPDGYFDSVEESVLGIVSSSEVKTKVISLVNKRNLTFIIGIAACLAVIITIALNKTASVSENFDLATVTEFIDEGYLDLTDFEVTNLLEEEELEALTFTPLTTTESIEDYLMDHIDEHNLLIE